MWTLKHVLNPICAKWILEQALRDVTYKEGENDRFFNGGNTQNSNDKEEEAFLRENARQTI